MEAYPEKLVESQSHNADNTGEPVGVALSIRTMGGQELVFHGDPAATTLLDLKQWLAGQLDAPMCELKLINGPCELCGGARSLVDLGLAMPGASVVSIRVPNTSKLNDKLINAISECRDSDARALIDRGAGFDTNGELAKDTVGSTILHLAARAGLMDLAIFLIRQGADVNAANEMGRQPLAVAAIKGLDALVRELLLARADPGHRDSNGKTAHDYAVRKGIMDTETLALMH